MRSYVQVAMTAQAIVSKRQYDFNWGSEAAWVYRCADLFIFLFLLQIFFYFLQRLGLQVRRLFIFFNFF